MGEETETRVLETLQNVRKGLAELRQELEGATVPAPPSPYNALVREAKRLVDSGAAPSYGEALVQAAKSNTAGAWEYVARRQQETAD